MIARNLVTLNSVTLGILAGGQGRRLGGVDKAFAQYQNQILLERTLEALGGGFCESLISYQGDNIRFRSYGISAVCDLRAGRLGPLAGIEALLAATSSEWLLSVPVDLRDIPAGLCETLMTYAKTQGQGSIVNDADGTQPLVALWPVTSALKAVSAALDRHEYAVHKLTTQLGMTICNLSPHRLGNLNTPSDFKMN